MIRNAVATATRMIATRPFEILQRLAVLLRPESEHQLEDHGIAPSAVQNIRLSEFMDMMFPRFEEPWLLLGALEGDETFEETVKSFLP